MKISFYISKKVLSQRLLFKKTNQYFNKSFIKYSKRIIPVPDYKMIIIIENHKVTIDIYKNTIDNKQKEILRNYINFLLNLSLVSDSIIR